MWDIKLREQPHLRVFSLFFHLNHVGYKATGTILLPLQELPFHLNHVGYKDI